MANSGTLFRSQIGGFNRDDVNNYIKETDIKYSTQIEGLKADLAKASATISNLKAEKEALLREKEEVSGILEEAKRKAEESENSAKEIGILLSGKDMPFDTETDIRYIINRLIPEFDCYTDYMKAVREDFPAERVREMHDAVIRNGDCCFLSDLAVNGKDMLALGLKGKEISDALQKSLSAVIEKRIPNNKEEIIAYLKKKCKSDAYTG